MCFVGLLFSEPTEITLTLPEREQKAHTLPTRDFWSVILVLISTCRPISRTSVLWKLPGRIERLSVWHQKTWVEVQAHISFSICVTQVHPFTFLAVSSLLAQWPGWTPWPSGLLASPEYSTHPTSHLSLSCRVCPYRHTPDTFPSRWETVTVSDALYVLQT